MIRIKTNLDTVMSGLADRLKKIRDKDYLLRPVAVNLIPQIKKRIHIDGNASDSGQIGVYSPQYMKVRTGDFKNAKRVTRGKNKGKLKDAGTFTASSSNAGQPRPRYNRSNDTKVIISLTRQLENDYAVLATENGYGIGFNNSFNTQKARWVEKTYKKKIFNLTKEERQYAIDKLNQLVNEALT